MNKPLVIGLGVAGVAVVGGIGYALYKRSATPPPASKFPAMPAGTDPRYALQAQQLAAQGPAAQLVDAPNQIFWADKSNQTRPASSIEDLRAQLLKEYGTKSAARLANVFIPGDPRAKPGGEWLPAAFYVWPMYDKDGKGGTSFEALQLKSLGTAGSRVPRAYAHAAGWARNLTLQRQNGLGGAQMVSGRGGR